MLEGTIWCEHEGEQCMCVFVCVGRGATVIVEGVGREKLNKTKQISAAPNRKVSRVKTN